jgi:hypothetical protein
MLVSRPACFTGSLPVLALVISGLAPVSHAQSTLNSNSDANLEAERRALAERFASERLWVWQKRLNLQGWKVSLLVSRASELKPKTLGNIRWDREKKTAVLRTLDPADYNLAFNEMLRDIEFTVVHELIHLEMVPVLSDLQRTEENRREEEDAVNHMAEALLKLDRGQ